VVERAEGEGGNLVSRALLLVGGRFACLYNTYECVVYCYCGWCWCLWHGCCILHCEKQLTFSHMPCPVAGALM
jgi:hypothetical protein